MQYISYYQSPLGSMMLASDLYGLTGLWFVGDRFYAEHLSPENAEKETSVMTETKRWLDTYFSGQIPAEPPLIHLTGTAFQREVCEIMLAYPTERRGRTAASQRKLPAGEICAACPLRQSARLSVTIRCASLCRAIALSARAEI